MSGFTLGVDGGAARQLQMRIDARLSVRRFVGRYTAGSGGRGARLGCPVGGL